MSALSKKCSVLLALTLAFTLPMSVPAEVIDKPVSSLEVLSKPSHDSELGNPPNLDGLRVRVTFTDGEEYIATADDFTVERYNPNQLGSQLVAIRYGGYPTQIALNVVESKILRVDVRLSNKTRYIGDSLSNDDFTVTLYYDTGRSEEIDNYEISTVRLIQDSTKVTISYGEFTQQLTVNAIKNSCTNLSVESPGKSEFRVGEEFTTDGLVVKAEYKSGYIEDVTAKCEIIEPDMKLERTQTVRIKYEGRETSYNVDVRAFTFDYADTSEYQSNGKILLYFVGKEEPIEITDGIWYSDDYSNEVRNYTIHYADEVYSVEGEIPEDEMRFVGSTRIRAQVPIGITVVADDSGTLGLVRKTELQNKSDIDVSVTADIVSSLEQLSGLPKTWSMREDSAVLFSLDIAHEKVYDTAMEFFRPFRVRVEVPIG